MIKTHFFAMKSNNKSALKSVQIPTDPMPLKYAQSKKITDWKVLTDPEGIENVLIEWNRVHVGQVEGTLFTKSEIVKYIGKNSCEKGVDDLLNGRNTYHHLQLTALQK